MPFSDKQKKLLFWWRPESPHADKDMIICDGSIRAGKTVAMIDSFLSYTLTMFDGGNFIIAAKSMGALERNVLQPMFEILTAKNIDYTYLKSRNPYVQVGKNTYYLFGAPNEAAQDTLQGLTASSAYLDEVALMPESFVSQAIGRCSVEGAKIFFNCNPEGAYHWFKTDYIDKAEEKKIYRLHFTMDDNPSLSEKTKDMYKRMFTGVFYDRNILGKWVAAEDVIYSMFSENQVVKDVPTMDDYVIGVDYGTNNPTAFILVGIKYNSGNENEYYILDEYYQNGREEGQMTVSQHYNELERFVENTPALKGVNINRRNMTLYVDPSASAFKAEVDQHGVFAVKNADNDVVNGIQTVQATMTSERFYVHERCTNVRKELASYVWDEKAADKGIDKPIKEHDHALDAVRYVIYTIEDSPVVRITEIDYYDW